jgi:hypothetical protein
MSLGLTSAAAATPANAQDSAAASTTRRVFKGLYMVFLLGFL